MTPLSILIVEDEIIIANVIKETLEKYNHSVVAILKSYNEVFSFLENKTPDFILIDIKLRFSTEDGISIAERINQDFKIPFIFLTSHNEQSIFQRAKNVHPAAYLFKPIRSDELIFQIELAYSHYVVNKKDSSNPFTSDDVFLPLNRGYNKINKNDLLYIEAAKSYSNLYLKDSIKPLLLSINLGDLVQYFLSPNFYKLSRSYLINLNHVSRIELDNIYFSDYEKKIAIPQGTKAGLIKNFALIKTT